jgi:hypothetical protein
MPRAEDHRLGHDLKCIVAASWLVRNDHRRLRSSARRQQHAVSGRRAAGNQRLDPGEPEKVVSADQARVTSQALIVADQLETSKNLGEGEVI